MLRDLTSNLPLQSLIEGVIQNASVKLAEDEKAKEEKVRHLVAHEQKEHGHFPSKKEEKAEYGEDKESCMKTAGLTEPGFVEKLASACDYIADNTDSIVPAQRGILTQAISKLAEGAVGNSPQGPGKGDTALDLNQATGGTQKYKKDKPAGDDPAQSEAGTGMQAAELPGGATQIANDRNQAPGQSSGAVPHAKYPEKGPLVNLGKTAGASDTLKTIAELAARHPAAAGAAAGTALGATAGAIGTPGHPGRGAVSGGLLGGATGALVGRQMGKTAAEIAKAHILAKLAGEDVMKADISSPRSAGPLPGEGGLTVTDATQPQSGPGGPTSGYGNQGRKLIASNEAAINYTKRDAKGPQKSQLAQVLEEPALSAAHDSKLKENLRNTEVAKIAGVKIAAAQAAFLQKVAEAGCTCNGGEQCRFCKLKTAASRLHRIKLAQGMGGGGGMNVQGNSPPMGSFASADEAPDGCTCGQTGECRVCKLKAALEAAKGGGGGQPGVAPQQ